MSLSAFLDESEPERGVYLLCAAIVSEQRMEAVRSRMRVLAKGSKKAHWHEAMHRSRRMELMTAVAECDVVMILVRVSRRPEVRAERLRRLCLERLLHEVSGLPVSHVVLESRGPADDRRDRALVDGLRGRRQVDPKVRIDHVPGPAEPILWIPDVVCGAHNARSRGDDQYFARVADRVEEVEA